MEQQTRRHSERLQRRGAVVVVVSGGSRRSPVDAHARVIETEMPTGIAILQATATATATATGTGTGTDRETGKREGIGGRGGARARWMHKLVLLEEEEEEIQWQSMGRLRASLRRFLRLPQQPRVVTPLPSCLTRLDADCAVLSSMPLCLSPIRFGIPPYSQPALTSSRHALVSLFVFASASHLAPFYSHPTYLHGWCVSLFPPPLPLRLFLSLSLSLRSCGGGRTRWRSWGRNRWCCSEEENAVGLSPSHLLSALTFRP